MKTRPLIVFLSVSAMLLSACGTKSTSSTSRFRAANFTLTPESRLALGTLKLEGTPQAVDAAMAAKLLPLWQLLEQLNTSNTAAPQEVQAVVDSIRATMSPAQVQAIDGMKLAAADMQSLFQGQGQTARAGGTSSSGGFAPRSSSNGTNGTNRNGGGQGFFFAGGGIPGGGFPGGGGFGGNANRSATGSTTQSQNGSTQQTRTASTAITGFLINRVIQLLQSRAQS